MAFKRLLRSGLLFFLVIAVTCVKKDEEVIINPPPSTPTLIKNPCSQLSLALQYCTIISPADGTVFFSKNPKLSWNLTSHRGPVYTIYLGTNRDNLKIVSTQTVTNYEFKNPERGELYYWKFSSRDTCGYGCTSSIFSFSVIPDTNLPFVVSDPNPIISGNSVSLGGNIVYSGTSSLQQAGFFLSKLPDPEKTGRRFLSNSTSGKYFLRIDKLDANTHYYECAFATNQNGTSYGDVREFSTTGNLQTDSVTDITGNRYSTIQIGGQLWMGENLNTTKLNDGSPLTFVTDNSLWINYNGLAACFLNNDTANSRRFGTIYNGIVVETRKICPVGWHVPSDKEWMDFERYLGMNEQELEKIDMRGTYQGLILKSTTGWAENKNGFNSLGYNGIPAGMRLYNGTFYEEGLVGQWWSSTKTENFDYMWTRSLMFNGTGISRRLISVYNGCSIRCIKD